MLGGKVATPSRDDLIEAAQVLNHAIYLRYKTFQHRAMNELEKKCGFNGEGKKLSVYQDAKPREFSIDNPERCRCEQRLVENYQCDHEIKLYDGFCKHLFEERHFARDRVTGSLTGWDAPPNDETEIILGVADDLDTNNHEELNLFER